MAAGVVLAKVVPKQVKPVLPKAVLVSRLKDEIFAMRYNRLENKYYLGKKIWQLQQLHGKAGHGTFLDDLAELDIARTSAYRWIHFFQDVYQGLLDPTPARITKAQTAKLLSQMEGPSDDIAAELELTADQDRKKVAEAIAVAKEHVAKSKAKHKGKRGGYNVKVVFTETERTRFKVKCKELGLAKASKIIYQAVMNATK